MSILELFSSVTLAVKHVSKDAFLHRKMGTTFDSYDQSKSYTGHTQSRDSAKNGATRGQQMVTKAQGRISHCEL